MLLHSKYRFQAVHRCGIPIVPYSLNFCQNNSDSFAYCCSVSKTIVHLSVRFSLHINPLVLHSVFPVDQAKWQYTHIIRASGTCFMCAVGKQMFFFFPHQLTANSGFHCGKVTLISVSSCISACFVLLSFLRAFPVFTPCSAGVRIEAGGWICVDKVPFTGMQLGKTPSLI